MIKQRKDAFTLAEVLITLVIIGVIAAMTIPTLLNNTNSQEYRTALKKAVSTLNQAITMHYALEGMTVADYGSNTALSTDLFQKRLNVISTTAGAGYKGGVTGATFYTADGIMYTIGATSACSADGKAKCATVYIDVNGDKKPNTKTTEATKPKDGYQVDLYSQRAVPSDTATQGVMYDQGLYYD